jgi:hypothetical protein
MKLEYAVKSFGCGLLAILIVVAIVAACTVGKSALMKLAGKPHRKS